MFNYERDPRVIFTARIFQPRHIWHICSIESLSTTHRFALACGQWLLPSVISVSLLFIVLFLIKTPSKKRTQPTFSRFDLMGVIFKEGGNPPHHQLSTLLARSKNGRANQSNAQPGVRKKPKWRPVVWASFYWNHVLLDQKTCFSMSKYRTSHF